MGLYNLRNPIASLAALIVIFGGYYLIRAGDDLLSAQSKYVNSSIVVETWKDGSNLREALDLGIAGPNAKEYIYISTPYRWQGEFNALGVLWQQELQLNTELDIWVRTSDGGNWSDWLYVWTDVHGKAGEGHDHGNNEHAESTYLNDYNKISDLLPLASRHDRLQYRVKLTSKESGITPKLERIRFELIKAPTKQVTSYMIFKNRLLGLVEASGFRIISRSEWGADESLRVFKADNPPPVIEEITDEEHQKFADELKVARRVTHNANGQRLTWPLEYPEGVRKIVLHHTAGLQNPPDSAEYIRSLYYWHTITKGWGDLGYNYIIDKDGNVFEGRAGGDGVIAAHVGLANTGSVGIGILGNYENDYLTPQTKIALVRLIQEKAVLFSLDPTERNSFRGKLNYTVVGHKDVGHTRCPGEHLYAALPEIRALASEALRSGSILNREQSIREAYQAKQMPDNPQTVSMSVGEDREVKLRFQNTGTAQWDKRTFLAKTDGDGLTFVGARGNKVAILEEASVPSGQIGTFVLKLQTGEDVYGLQAVKLVPVVNNLYSLYSDLAELNVVVSGSSTSAGIVQKPSEPDYKAKVVMQSERDILLNPFQIKELWIDIKNIGLAGWPDGAIALGTWGPQDRDSVFRDLTWMKKGRVIKFPRALFPGEQARIGFQVTAPEKEGEFLEKFNLVVEGKKWLLDEPAVFHLTVKEKVNVESYPLLSSRKVGVSEDAIALGVAYPYPILADQEETRLAEPYNAVVAAVSLQSLLMVPGEQKEVWVDVKNIGSSVWPKNRLRLATSKPHDRMSVFTDETWLKNGRAAAVDAAVPSDGKVRFTFNLTAPSEAGIYQEHFAPILEGIKWLDDAEVVWEIRVTRNGTAVLAPEPVLEAPQAENEPLVRVEVGFSGVEVQVSASGKYKITAPGLEPLIVDASTTLLKKRGDKIEITGHGQGKILVKGPVRFAAQDDAILKVDNYENRPAWNPKLNDNLYRHLLEARDLGDKLFVINELPLEQYLLGVAEVPNDEPLEKQKTIAVLARSYAYFYATTGGKHPERGSTINSTGDDQVFKGYNFELRAPNFKRAVQSTKGEMVTYQNMVVKAPFFNQSDGRTRSWEEVWGSKNHPYAVSVPDPYCEGLERNGHGVGVSGCGAKAMAEHGKNYQEILNYYLKDIELMKMY